MPQNAKIDTVIAQTGNQGVEQGFRTEFAGRLERTFPTWQADVAVS